MKEFMCQMMFRSKERPCSFHSQVCGISEITQRAASGLSTRLVLPRPWLLLSADVSCVLPGALTFEDKGMDFGVGAQAPARTLSLINHVGCWGVGGELWKPPSPPVKQREKSSHLTELLAGSINQCI